MSWYYLAKNVSWSFCTDQIKHSWKCDGKLIRKMSRNAKEKAILSYLYDNDAQDLIVPFEFDTEYIYLPNGRPLNVLKWPETKIDQEMFELCGKLAKLHSKGVLHRDLKPYNLLYYEKSIRFMDWNLSRFDTTLPVLHSKLTEFYPNKEPKDWLKLCDQIIGVTTYYYSCPFVLQSLFLGNQGNFDTENLDSRVLDYWALGCTWLRMLRGKEFEIVYTKKYENNKEEQRRDEYLQILLYFAGVVSPSRFLAKFDTKLQEKMLEQYKNPSKQQLQDRALIANKSSLINLLMWDPNQRRLSPIVHIEGKEKLSEVILVTNKLRAADRQKYLLWALALCYRYNLEYNTWFLSIHLLDEYLTLCSQLKYEVLQITCCCLLLASELCESGIFTVKRAVHQLSGRYNTSQLQVCCLSICEILKFRLWRTTLFARLCSDRQDWKDTNIVQHSIIQSIFLYLEGTYISTSQDILLNQCKQKMTKVEKVKVRKSNPGVLGKVINSVFWDDYFEFIA